jgi:hypothetical protein
MQIFHGTVAHYLPAIKKMGLLPTPQNAWKALAWDNAPMHEENAVYLTTSYNHAASYAESKAAYLAAEPGSKFPVFGDMEGQMTKLQDAPVIHTKPVVIVLEIEEDDRRLEHDSEDDLALVYRGALPPSSIRDIKLVAMAVSPDEDPIRKEKVNEEISMLAKALKMFVPGHRPPSFEEFSAALGG